MVVSPFGQKHRYQSLRIEGREFRRVMGGIRRRAQITSAAMQGMPLRLSADANAMAAALR